MSQSTISTFKVFEMFPDAETARLYLESRLRIVDKVISYRPKPKSNAAKKRKRRRAKHA